MEEQKKSADAEKPEEAIEVKEEKKDTLLPVFFAHGPAGTGQCYYCHEASATAVFRQYDKGSIGAVKSSPASAGRLIMPLREICTDCHMNKSAQAAYDKNLYLHGPAADGSCTVCHSPHKSYFPYMLVSENTIELCTQCHLKGYILETGDHAGGKECVGCHNAHAGKDRFLLKRDYNEAF